MAPKRTIDHAEVVRLYQEDETRSATDVARMMGIDVTSVLKIVKEAHIEVRKIRPKGRPRRKDCSRCEVILEATDTSGKCAPCQKDYLQEYHLLKKYGITQQQRAAMVLAQGGRCALCDEIPKVLVVDHCHETGVIRGMLCIRCNLGLGRFGDNVEGLKRAIAYLERGLI